MVYCICAKAELLSAPMAVISVQFLWFPFAHALIPAMNTSIELCRIILMLGAGRAP